MSVLQFLLNLSDRQAAEAVRCRIDFKYALAFELDDPGFHYSVLTDFRDRVAQDGRADELLGLALERMKQAGLITERGKARTDSTYVLAAVRDLTRLELITEAVRAALEELAHQDPEMLDWLIDQDWATRYGRPVRLGGQPSRAATPSQAGRRGRPLPAHHARSPPAAARAEGRRAAPDLPAELPDRGRQGPPRAPRRTGSRRRARGSSRPTTRTPASRCVATRAGPGT